MSPSEYVVNPLIKEILDEAVKQEDDIGIKKQEVYTNLANALIQSGIDKSQVSTIGKKLLEDHLYEKKYKQKGISREEVKLNPTHWYETMSKIGCINQFYSHKKPDVASETEPKNSSTKQYPHGIEFDILSMLLEISKNNQNIIEKIQQKLVFDKNFILKQKKSKTDSERQERLDTVQNLIESRRELVKTEIQKISNDNPEEFLIGLRQLKSQQLQLERFFDDRSSITYYQKIMALFAVSIGYDKNEISRFLHITSKHMKLNIYSPEAQYDLLLLLKWFDRCPNPNCGVNLSDFFEAKVSEFKKGKPLSEIGDFEIEPLVVTGYQKENLRLVEENKKLKQKLSEN